MSQSGIRFGDVIVALNGEAVEGTSDLLRRIASMAPGGGATTVAIEVPIWLTEDDIAMLEHEHGIELTPRDSVADRTITGHIDFLQVRNGAVHILDYKPDARTNKPIAQLAIYALALTRRAPGLKLFDIKCAWFVVQRGGVL